MLRSGPRNVLAAVKRRGQGCVPAHRPESWGGDNIFLSEGQTQIPPVDLEPPGGPDGARPDTPLTREPGGVLLPLPFCGFEYHDFGRVSEPRGEGDQPEDSRMGLVGFPRFHGRQVVECAG